MQKQQEFVKYGKLSIFRSAATQKEIPPQNTQCWPNTTRGYLFGRKLRKSEPANLVSSETGNAHQENVVLIS